MIHTTPIPSIPGALQVQFPIHTDERGESVKFHDAGPEIIHSRSPLLSEWEFFYSHSHSNVLRGMHGQKGQSKLMCLVSGRILDVILDVRQMPPSHQSQPVHAIEMEGGKGQGLYVPDGVLHGFYVLDGPAVIVYQTDTQYDPSKEYGVRWDSFGFEWPYQEFKRLHGISTILSDRDQSLPTLEEFLYARV